MKKTVRQLINFANDQDSNKIDSRSYINLKNYLLGKDALKVIEDDARYQAGEEYKYSLPIQPSYVLGLDMEDLGPKAEEYADKLHDKLADLIEGKKGQTKLLGIDVDLRSNPGEPVVPFVKSIKDVKALTEKLFKTTFVH